MTETFWIAASVLILFALLFVLYPVFFHRPKARLEADIRNQNLLAYRTRLKELDDEHKAGVLDDESHRQLKEELAGAMLDDVPENEAPRRRVAGRRSAVMVALLALVFLPVGTWFGYQQWGAIDQVEQYITMQQMQASPDGQTARMAELADQLHQRLQQNPDNAEGWAMLGQTYMRIRQFDDATEAYRTLAEVTGSDPVASATAYGLAAQAQFFAGQGRLTPAVQSLVDEALARNPDEVNSLGLLGIHAFGQERFRDAIEYWERITQVAPDHPQLASIQDGIREAYRQLGETPPASLAAPASDGVTVRLALSEAALADVPGDATVFVFARPVGDAGGAPVAVTRLTAADLPVTVRLDDNYAMSPQTRISQQDAVRVVARVSLGGSVNPQPGDWEGAVQATVTSPDTGEEPVGLVVDQPITE